jgi:Predicted ATPase
MLGGLRLRGSDGVEVTRFRTQKAAALLAYLALRPHRQYGREELADLFWPDATPESARVNLRTTLSSVRRTLRTTTLPGEQFLLSQGNHTIGLAPDLIETDVARFEAAVRQKRWDEANRLYAGPFLPGFYDDWILLERERLETLHAEVLAALAARGVASGDADGNAEATQTGQILLLPPEPGHFFGREDELDRLGQALAENRLVTLTGAGGMGKTRLALAAARRYARRYPGVVAFLPLADVTDARQVLTAIRDGFGLPRDPRAEPIAQIAAFLGEAPALLVLDNFEQVAAGGAPVVQRLLTEAPSLSLLVTSRRRLGLPGERLVSLGALDEGAGIKLFAARAASVNPEFALTERNAGDVAALVRDLEGVPLAIELAASRAQSLTPAEMRERLAERFALLATPTRHDKSSRHRSLWAAMDWSYRLLTPEQRRLFARLSVFRGGWTARAASVVTGEEAALEYLAQLRERSLLFGEERDGGIRWGMLESLRAFAAEQLSEKEWQEVAARHAEWVRDLTARCREAAWTPREDAALAEAERERANIEAAIQHLAEQDDVEGALHLAADVGFFWYRRGYLREGEQIASSLLERSQPGGAARLRVLVLLADLLRDQGRLAEAEARLREAMAEIVPGREGDETVRARVHQGLGLLAVDRGDTVAAREHLEPAAAYWEETGNRPALALTLTNLTRALVREYRDSEAVPQGERALALYQEIGSDWGVATMLAILANSYVGLGEDARARQYYEQGMETYRRINNPYGVATCLRGLGHLCMNTSRWTESLSFLRQALTRSRDLGDRWSAAICIHSIAVCLAHLGDPERAARLLGWRDTYDTAEAITLTPQERALANKREDFVRSALPAERFVQCFAEGAALPFEGAVALALAPDTTEAPLR